jgi:hypothetical protein
MVRRVDALAKRRRVKDEIVRRAIETGQAAQNLPQRLGR